MSVRAKEKLKLYFIAIIPPSPGYEEVMRIKNYFKEQYNSKAALNSPPHITLHMPFRWNEEKENKLVDSLQSFVQGLRPFAIQLENFSSFPPKVIFMNVVKSEALERLQKELQRFCKRALNLFNADYKDLPFHAHLTLAFRDLKKANYQKAWEEFSQREYHADFNVDKVVLLKHNGKVWQVFREFNLDSTSS